MKFRLSSRKLNAALAVVFSIFCMGTAKAQWGNYNGFDWSRNGNAITITGYTGPGGAVTIPSVITNLPVTSIGADAFYWNGSITSVTIPNSVTNIGDSAFIQCSNLTSVSMGNGVVAIGRFAFLKCAINSLTIPNGSVIIGSFAFDSCERLTSASIGNGSSLSGGSIGNDAFWGCTNLTTINVANGVTNIGDGAFSGCGSLTGATLAVGKSSNNGGTSIGNGTFSDCTNLINLTLGDNIVAVGSGAFSACPLDNAVFSTNIISIGNSAFQNCSMPAISISSTATNIGEYAFYGCAKLVVANIGNVTAPSSGGCIIGNSAFDGCNSLTNVIIGNNVTVMGASMFFECTNLTTVTIGSNVKSIAPEAFFTCEKLSRVNIPNSVTNIEDSAFMSCSSLSNIILPNGVLNIGSDAFYLCSNLRNVIIPASVTTIGMTSFVGCTSLTNVVIGSGVTDIGWGAFALCTNLFHVCFQGNAPTDEGLDWGFYIFERDSRLSVIFYVAGTSGWGTTFDGIGNEIGISPLPTASCADCLPSIRSVTALRITPDQANIHSTDGIDDPIVPVTDTTILAGATNALGKGVVADEVTPVLFRVVGSPGNYTLDITNTVLTYTNGPLSSRLHVLASTGWQKSTNLTLVGTGASTAATNYVYLEGLRWTDFTGTATEITATLNVRPVGFQNTAYSTSFKVRPTPVVLIHGIADDKRTWSADFSNQFNAGWPSDFLVPIQYGVGSGDTPLQRNFWPNTYQRLDILVSEVDGVLQDTEKTFSKDWSFTRYDIVAHSQGGVLVRMLCQINGSSIPPFGSATTSNRKLVVSQSNFFRGRFRRIVTIGSPHNGSLISWYTRMYMIEFVKELGSKGKQIPLLLTVLPFNSFDKFDPFWEQVQEINNAALPADPKIKFNCIRTAINSGGPPVGLFNDPLCYTGIGLSLQYGLTGKTRGQILLPRGSDGVVDFVSEGGGNGTKTTTLASDISHMEAPLNAVPSTWPPFLKLFGILPGHTQTHFADVASSVVKLLNGPTNAFGPFILPSLLTTADKATYEPLVPIDDIRVATIKFLYFSGGVSAFGSSRALTTGVTNYSFQAQTNDPIVGNVFWTALVYNTNGISTNGIATLVNTNDQSIVTIVVDNSLVGDVVLSAMYATTNSGVVFAGPIVVASHSQGTLNSISIDPSSAFLTLGQYMGIQVIGNYNNGLSSYLFPALGQATFNSSNTNIASVDTNGVVFMKASGTATIAVTYKGFSAQCIVSNSAPIILQNPVSQTSVAGSNVTFTVSASSADAMTYQWRRNSVNLTNSSRISGATNATLAINSLLASDGGNYDVLVANSSGPVASAVAVLTIRETVPPTCTITVPAANASVSNATITVSGKAGDNQGVSNVVYQLNNGPWANASPVNNWSNWTAIVSLNQGTNRLSAYAVDLSGNFSTTNTVSFVYVVSAKLTVTTNGLGSISPNYNGSLLRVGTTYSMTATPGSGFKFSGWTGSYSTNGATLTFTMASNLVFTANFTDTNRPVVSMTNVATGLRVSNSVFTVKGTAKDNWQMSHVYYQFNGGAWSNAVTANAWTNWSGLANLKSGTNTVAAYGVDNSGNISTTNVASVFYVVSAQLQVAMTGKGTLKPNYTNVWLEIGRNYSITSAPAVGFRFDGWTGSILTNAAVLNFMLVSNLSLMVHFTDTNPPTLTVSAPSNGQKMTNALAAFKGTAKDNWGVAGVWYQLNNAAWQLASTTNHWTNWGTTLKLMAGTNTIRAFAQDLGGNYSPTGSLSILSSNTFKLNLNFGSAPLQKNGLTFTLELSSNLAGRIEYSTNLINWVSWTNFKGNGSAINFRDAKATNSPKRFYRAVVP
jgi:pimeloyl-ACP methyl ester carboxylesterase